MASNLSGGVGDKLTKDHRINLSKTGGVYLRKWTGSSLVQVEGCRLFGTKAITRTKTVLFNQSQVCKITMHYFADLWLIKIAYLKNLSYDFTIMIKWLFQREVRFFITNAHVHYLY